jgi:hypothetical protein
MSEKRKRQRKKRKRKRPLDGVTCIALCRGGEQR